MKFNQTKKLSTSQNSFTIQSKKWQLTIQYIPYQLIIFLCHHQQNYLRELEDCNLPIKLAKSFPSTRLFFDFVKNDDQQLIEINFSSQLLIVNQQYGHQRRTLIGLKLYKYHESLSFFNAQLLLLQSQELAYIDNQKQFYEQQKADQLINFQKLNQQSIKKKYQINNLKLKLKNVKQQNNLIQKSFLEKEDRLQRLKQILLLQKDIEIKLSKQMIKGADNYLSLEGESNQRLLKYGQRCRFRPLNQSNAYLIKSNYDTVQIQRIDESPESFSVINKYPFPKEGHYFFEIQLIDNLSFGFQIGIKNDYMRKIMYYELHKGYLYQQGEKKILQFSFCKKDQLIFEYNNSKSQVCLYLNQNKLFSVPIHAQWLKAYFYLQMRAGAIVIKNI